MGRGGPMSVMEVAVATALMLVVISLAVGAVVPGIELQTYMAVDADANRRGEQAASWAAAVLKGADGEFIVVDGTEQDRQILFSLVEVDPATAVVTTEPGHKLIFELSDTETDNGLDDDGNGLADDGVLYLEQPSASRTALVANVLPGSLQLTQIAGSEREFVLRFQMGFRLDPEANVYNQSQDPENLYPSQPGFLILTLERRFTVTYYEP